MPWQIVTLITPEENIGLGGKIINIHNVEIIKIDEHGGLNFIEKQVDKVSKEEATELEEQAKLFESVE